MKDVTIIIKTFERYDCLKRLVKSILKYYPDVKILIGDDSFVSCEEKIKKDFDNNNIEVFSLPYDCGLSYGRNYLVNKVKTKYFCLVDDDFVFDKKTDLQTALNILKEKKLSIIGGHIRNYKIIKTFKDKVLYLAQKVSGLSIPSNYLGTFDMSNENELKVNYIIHSYPEYQETDLILNFFIAVTKDILACPWDDELKLQEHTAFFYEAKKRGLKVAYTNKFSVRHCPVQLKGYDSLRGRNYSQIFLRKNNFNRIIAEYDEVKRNHITTKEELKDILVSVIVPVYNAENIISKLMNSLNSQIYKNLEIILVDNNSKDNSLNILKEYAKKDKRIKVLEEKKQGPNHARKTGFIHSKGEYVTFVDSDDYLEDDAIFNYVKTITNTGADYVIGDYKELTPNLTFTRYMKCAPNTSENLKDNLETLLYKQTLGIRIIKRDLILEDNFIFTKIGEDMVLSKTALALAKNVRYMNSCSLNYIIDENGLSSRVNYSHLLECMETCRLLKEKFINIKAYEKYKQEVDFIMITHPLYRAFRGELLENKEERENLRAETIKYLDGLDYKNNKYYKKSLVYKTTDCFVRSKWLYNNPIIRWCIKLLFTNKLFNKIMKKLDSR